jgi:chromate transport protein ChrA
MNCVLIQTMATSQLIPGPLSTQTLTGTNDYNN